MIYPHRRVLKLQVTSQSFELCWHSSLPCNQELFSSRENLWMQLTVWKARKSATFCTREALGATQCTMNFASHHCNLVNVSGVNGTFHGRHESWRKKTTTKKQKWHDVFCPSLKVIFVFRSHPKLLGQVNVLWKFFRGSPLQSSRWYTRARVVCRGEQGEREGWSLFGM